MPSFREALEDLRQSTEMLRPDFSNWLEWHRSVATIVEFSGNGLDQYLTTSYGSESKCRQTCKIIWDYMSPELKNDAALRALYERADACGLWDTLEARDLKRRNASTAGERIRSLEKALNARIDDKEPSPLFAFLEGQTFERFQTRPGWHTMGHLETELKAVAIKRALAAFPGGEARAKQFAAKLEAVSGPLDQRGLERICIELDDLHNEAKAGRTVG
ncbi:hypothetical protein AURDEDRAFT_188980 [Auricularia subglabra TFB-10046 SS5]|uniref:Uncharacterized protein n=1 Tax=Auricularia subglabra (strain TFB-10046 / SS5) TaxID=717982 RepID=J0LDD0_AURST|nr:hypothetical protein AURDEDRAFT_188980 [Auricularia subglabra TFB-10046 SS5]